MEEQNQKSRTGLKVVSAIALIITLVVAALFLTVYVKLSKIQEENDNPPSEIVTEEIPEEAASTLDELRSEKNLSSILRDWATNSEHDDLMQSEDVINFLLIGLDEGDMRSDVMMLLSVDKKDKKLHLTSLFRDSYTYIKTPEGETFGKLNSAYNYGADTLVETIENNYKINIDYYASINFRSFVKIVDIMDGIVLPVEEYEAAAIGKGCPAGGEVKLNGEQALGYCRIRYCDADGDVSRTRRQRQFVSAVIRRTKEVKISQIGEILDTLLSYVKTDCPTGRLVSLATQALTGKWYSYPISPLSVPKAQHRMDYRGYQWVWIADYPAAAKDLQEELYGKSNINLLPGRESVLEIMRNTEDTGEAKP